jgi:hypothetical protein
MPRPSWYWKSFSVGTFQSGRTLINLFEESPLTYEELLAREAIQNSKDAHGTLRAAKTNGRIKLNKIPEFRMEFRLEEFKGNRLKEVWDFLDLSDLKKFLTNSLSNKQNNASLPTPEVLDLKKSLQILTISDFGAIGLGGNLLEAVDSNYFRALLSIGLTGDKPKNAGGTRGYGKAAVIASSSIFTVLAYSRFPETKDYKTTRHFGGVVYTFDHKDGARNYSGIGTFGDPSRSHEQVFFPLVDQDADFAAQTLGIPIRKDTPSDYGTTLVVVSPSIDLKEVLRTVEHFWWPAINDGNLDIDFYFPGSKSPVVPRPKSHANLLPYFEAYEIAKGNRDPVPPYEAGSNWEVKDRSKLNREVEKSGTKKYSYGRSAYRIDKNSGFVESDGAMDESKSPNSFVALIRSLGMVINYEELTFRKDPIVHGVFIASDEAEEIFVKQEPPSHSRWFHAPRQLEHLAKKKPETAAMLREIQEKLRDDIKQLKKRVQPPEELKRKRIEILAKSFGVLFKNPKKGSGETVKRNGQSIQINWLKKAELELGAKGGDSRRYRSKIRVRNLSPNVKIDQEFAVSFSARIVEDEDQMGDRVNFQMLNFPENFVLDADGSAIGSLAPEKWYEFEGVTSDLGLTRVLISANVRDVSNDVVRSDAPGGEEVE